MKTPYFKQSSRAVVQKRLLLLIALLAIVAASVILRPHPHFGRAGRISDTIDPNSLILNRVITGEEPYMFTYSMPLNIDVHSNRWTLGLMDNGKDAGPCSFTFQTNGTYLVRWNTIFATYGPHILQVGLYRPYRDNV